MKNYFSIANNILTGSLRPWTKENQDEAKFGHLLNQKLRLNKDKPSEFCNSAIHAFKSLNFITENENLEELRELSRVETVEKINIEIPQFFNKQTEFYSYLLTNSFHNILSGTFEAIKNSEEIDGTYKLFLLLTKLETLISLFKYDTNANNVTILIMNTLGLHLFATHSILNQKFNKLIDFEVLSENEVLYQLCPELESEKIDKSKLAYYLHQYISLNAQKSETATKDEKPPLQLESEKISFESFRYIDYDKKYDNLTNLWDSLKKNNFIAADTDSRIFKKVFSGKAITKPVVWTGNPSEFSYFIKLIYTINNYIEDLKQRNWEVACKCFVQADGTPFDRSKLRTLKKPQLSYKQLELTVDNLR